MKILLLLITGHIFFSFFPGNTAAATYYTWEGFEPDKLASMWLLKHVVDRNAEIKIVAKNATLAGAIPFDTPTARLRRYHTESTFETITRTFGIKADAVICIGRIIHEIEINTWDIDSESESQKVKEDIWTIIDASDNQHDIITNSYIYFNHLAKRCEIKPDK